MIPSKPIGQKLTLLSIFIFVLSIVNISSAQDGRAVFISKCASCHVMGKESTGPNLQGVLSRWDGNMDNLKLWIHNYSAAVSAGIPRAIEAEKLKPTQMTIFATSITDAEIEAVVKYVDEWQPAGPKPGEPSQTETSGGGQNAVIFGVISLILAIIALILMQVNSNLKKMSDDVEGIGRPEPVPFYRNKVYIAMIALVFFAVAGFFFARAGIGFGRQKGYEPEQPIFYSHKVHAGINQINCLYCHGNAFESKHATIPAVNVCMNCHKAITSYEKGPKLYRADGTEVNGTNEIAKLFKYAGFDPAQPDMWDASKAKPIKWEKIHNLPDHVYFNHAQHVKAGKVQCQTCHGEITAMDEVKQVSELSMGWCVNCHRETKVDFNSDSTGGNKFYSIYEKFHNDIKNHKMDSVTVADIGGLECQKCHY